MTEHTDRSVDRTGAARCVFEVRRLMKEVITAELVLNPAFDMLLMLYVERDRDGPVSSHDVCAEAGVTDTVCHHWARALEQRGLIDIGEDDYRLTPDGQRTMDELSEKVSQLLVTHLAGGSPDADTSSGG